MLSHCRFACHLEEESEKTYGGQFLASVEFLDGETGGMIGSGSPPLHSFQQKEGRTGRLAPLI